ncbi:MAG: gamma-glutamylcyclotransferase family protein [Leucobacter sp.]
MTHRVFSYGTLRQPEVQRSLYGREVPTSPDALPGHRLDWVAITDPEVIRVSGSDRHPILRAGAADDAVEGACLELNDVELEATDDYEIDDYARRSVVLASGIEAWAYLASEDRDEDRADPGAGS